MKNKEFKKLLTITESEPIGIDSYMCLKEDNVEQPYGRWGWNKSLKKIQDHFLYIFILGTIVQYNEEKQIHKIRNEIVMAIINNKSLLNIQLSTFEQEFYKLWNQASMYCEFECFKHNSEELCFYLSSIGYKLNFILYKNPVEALDKALELDEFLPEGEYGFGEFLKENISNEY